MITRRHAMMLLASVPLALASPAAQALETITYSEAALAAAEASGKPYLLDFFATWCSTCRAQERVLDALMADDARYRAIPIVRVDWDEHARGPLVARLAIPRRSTLVLMSGKNELARLVADTRPQEIAGLLDKGL
jgi:thioredoxin 1